MFSRRVTEDLIKWKKDSQHKPLILRGARQVGKTSIVRLFAKDAFSDLFEFNLEKKEHLRIFDGVVSVDDFISRAEIYKNRKFNVNDSLLFIDEIQESPEIMKLLRFFAEDYPEIYLIATGSLLEAKMSGKWNVPVGRVSFSFLYPLTFLEYLTASGNGLLADEIKSVRFGQNCSWHEIANKEFEKYSTIGGMPEVVSSYVEDKDLLKVKQILSELQTTYIEDVSKYVKSMSEKKYLEWVVEFGPKYGGSLIKYEGFAGSNYRSREMSQAFSTVEKTRLLYQTISVNSTNIPLNFKFKRPKKLIWMDVGFLNYSNNLYSDLVKGIFDGKAMEQIVGQTLLAQFKNTPMKLGYWAKDRTKGSAEVDFCWQWRDKLIGLEVKSGNSQKSRSLASMVKEGGGKVIPIQISWNKLQKTRNDHLNIPFYLLERWEEMIKQAWKK